MSYVPWPGRHYFGVKCLGDSKNWLCGTSRLGSMQCPHVSWEGCFERSNKEGWKGNVLYTSSHAWEHTPKSCINKESQGSMGHITNLLSGYGQIQDLKTTNS